MCCKGELEPIIIDGSPAGFQLSIADVLNVYNIEGLLLDVERLKDKPTEVTEQRTCLMSQPEQNVEDEPGV